MHIDALTHRQKRHVPAKVIVLKLSYINLPVDMHKAMRPLRRKSRQKPMQQYGLMMSQNQKRDLLRTTQGRNFKSPDEQ